MSLGGLSGIRAGGQQGQPQGSSANAGSSGQEFSLEQQAAGSSSQAALVRSHDISKAIKTTRIVTSKKKNRKGAPRSIIVDGEIYEVFLLAIA